MFYCEQCQQENGWTKGMRGRPVSFGPCEVCGRGPRDCFDAPASVLPEPKKENDHAV